MATFSEANTERDRLMNAYPGVTARITVLSSAFGVAVHDIRPSEVKTAGQKAVLGLGDVVNPGAVIAWSAAAEPGTWQAQYS